MSNTTTIDTKTLNAILKRLDKLTRDVAVIKERILDQEPPYGSDEWWEWSIKKGEEDIKAGRYTEVASSEELQTFLDSLKRS